MKKFIIAFLSISLIASCFTACYEKPLVKKTLSNDSEIPATQINTLYDSGLKLYKKGEYAEAVKVLEGAVLEDSKNPEVYMLLADSYVSVHRGNYAVAMLRHALDNIGESYEINKKIENLISLGYGTQKTVKLVKEEKYAANDDMMYYTEYYYDDNNNVILKMTKSVSDNLQYVVTYEYDENQNLIRESKSGPQWEYLGHSEYTYNSENNLNYRVIVDNTGRFEFNYSYDDSGNCISMDYSHELGEGRYDYSYDKMGRKYIEKWYDKKVGGDLVGTYKYIFDDNGNIVREDEYSSEGELYSYTEFELDEKGRKIKESYHYPDGELHNNCFYYEYEYDDDNGLKEKIKYNSKGELQEYTVYNYGLINQ